MTQSSLFSPLSLRDVELRNRIVVSPMWQYRGERGQPTDWHLMHLGRMADGGAGLVFQEGTTVELRGRGTVGDLGIWSDEHVAGLRRLTTMVRANGSVPGIQLMHSGRKGRTTLPAAGRGPLLSSEGVPDWEAWELVGPSAVDLEDGRDVPRAMTRTDISTTLGSFADAARRAHEAGFDVIELHGGHGYLMHQFLSELTNRRTDEYGGSFENRCRFSLEVVEAVRSQWPDDKPLFVRLSCVDAAGWTIEDTLELTQSLLAHGVDVVDCSSGGPSGAAVQDAPLGYEYQVRFSEAVRRGSGARTMAIGLIVHAHSAERIVADGRADLVGIGREALYNPNWPLDAAVKLGVEEPWALNHSGWALAGRRASVPDLVPSTHVDGAPPVR